MKQNPPRKTPRRADERPPGRPRSPLGPLRGGKRTAAALAAAVLAAALSLSACKPQAEVDPPRDLGESIVVSAFSQEYQDFESVIDTSFSTDLMERLSHLGDDPATGFRTAGSPAEAEAAALVETAMLQAGLQNVTRDRATVDGWAFKGASLVYENRKGGAERITLGGYPVNLVTSDEAMTLVDAGRGRAADYEGLDVRGKLVLLYADAPEDAGFQAVQAKLAGAKAVLLRAGPDAEPETAPDDRLLSHSFGAPADAPAFAISAADCKLLKAAIKRAENGELSVRFSADSAVSGWASAENIWGEIPGRNPEVVYMLSNYDGFYRSAFEGAAGVSAMLGIAKALCDSGFLPNKTIRFVACGAGEWGATNTPFEWGTGAWRQLSQLHPEWAEQAFAVLNIDAVYPLKNKLGFGMTATDEIYDFAARSALQLIETGMYGFTLHSPENPTGFLTEDILWNLFGIPAVAARPGKGDKFYDAHRHSNRDTVEALGFDDEAYRFAQLLFGKLILDLDETPVRPVNFAAGFRAIRDSLKSRPITNARLAESLAAAETAAATLAADTAAMNAAYLGADKNLRASIDAAAADLNRRLYALNRMLRDAFTRVNRSGALVLPHTEAFANAEALEAALSALRDRDAKAAVEALKGTDFGRYADYDLRVRDYFAAQDHAGTWAAGRAEGPVCRTDIPVESLAQKSGEQDPDLSAETEALDALLTQEKLRLRAILGEELSQSETILPHIDRAIADIAPWAANGD